MPTPKQKPWLLVDAGQLVTLAGGESPRRGKEMKDLAIVPRGALAIQGERIVDVGPTPAMMATYRGSRMVSAQGRVVTPGLVDAHTHLIFAGDRAVEFEMKTQGKRYLEISKAGMGILSTVKEVRKASERSLVQLARTRWERMVEHGTTCAEVKSGYGLTVRDEMKSLRAASQLREGIVPTFLGAHAIPLGMNRREYVRLIIDKMLPAARKWSRFCDVFCDTGALTPGESREVLEAAKRLGYGLKIHAEEFDRTGAARLAAELGAVSADHLIWVSQEDCRALAQAGVIAVLLPTTSMMMDARAPARMLIDAGNAVALGSDYNPGTSMTGNLQLVMHLACSLLKMSPAEALCAATLNAAHAVGEGGQRGSLEGGKRGDFVIWNATDYRHLAYEFGWNQVDAVYRGGKQVFSASP